MMKRAWFLVGVAMAAACPAAGHAEQRAIPIEAASDWQHAQSKLVLPPEAAGLKRWRLDDSGKDELDVAAGYQAPDDSHFATVYIYRPQITDAGLWFDRAKSVIRSIPAYRADAVGTEAISRMALTPSGPERGFRMVRPVDHEGNKSTGLAVLPIGGWIVKIRMTGKMDTAGMEQRLTAFVQALGWPAVDAGAPLPAFIEPCTGKLKFAKAKLTKPDMAQALIGGMLQMAASSKRAEAVDAPAAPLCLEEDAGIPYGVYRRGGATDGYILALTDAGRVVTVSPADDLDGKKDMYRPAYLDLGSSETFPNFKGLPSPKLVMETLPKTPVVSSVKVGSTTISVNSSK